MKRLHKRIMTACLALSMALAMAAPAMAAETRAIESPVGKHIRLYACGSASGPALHANGNYNQARIDSQRYHNSTPWQWRVTGNGNYAQIFTMQDGWGITLAVNLNRTAVSPGVYPVTLAATAGNTDDTMFYFSNYDYRQCRMWLSQGDYAGYRLYNDNSNPLVDQSDVFFYQSDNAPNSVWYWNTTF